MRAPLSWVRDFVDLPPDEDARDVAAHLVRAGLEVEKVETPGHDVSGPIVLGRIVDFVEETHSNGRTIRGAKSRSPPKTCAASSAAPGTSLLTTPWSAPPGAVLAGGFEISARKTYGHVSDGMICSARELGLGDDHTGILVPQRQSMRRRADALPLLGLRDAVFDISVTPDRGYCLSMRGIARGRPPRMDFRCVTRPIFRCPTWPTGYPVVLDDPFGCDRFVARTGHRHRPDGRVTAVDASTPPVGGMRPISLVVDVTNYVMLETGQPIHAYDRALLSGPLRARRAAPMRRCRLSTG